MRIVADPKDGILCAIYCYTHQVSALCLGVCGHQRPAVSWGRAKVVINQWASKLWFAPSDFAKKYTVEMLHPSFIPFYLFAADTASEYQATVHVGDSSKGEALSAAHMEGKYGTTYADILLCASVDNDMKEFLVSSFKVRLPGAFRPYFLFPTMPCLFSLSITEF